ncbi:hypothetical protein [Streptomyces noursei]|uniref:hypothetical protein n=1 Tax=Streptomyces noursei TaxID=1971 RepID=UPI0021A76EBB|nr:hypothetical protein [Streptomyces noursei]UWS77516.1 hypothetical protein N1H47_00440 [Streptomyces noursei]
MVAVVVGEQRAQARGPTTELPQQVGADGRPVGEVEVGFDVPVGPGAEGQVAADHAVAVALDDHRAAVAVAGEQVSLADERGDLGVSDVDVVETDVEEGDAQVRRRGVGEQESAACRTGRRRRR